MLYKDKKLTGGEILAWIVVTVICFPPTFAYGTAVLAKIWNWFVPSVTGWQPVTFWQAAGLAITFSCFTSAITREDFAIEADTPAGRAFTKYVIFFCLDTIIFLAAAFIHAQL